MQFFGTNGKERPIRLCDETRRFADESLHCKYGRMAKETPAVCMDDVPQFETLSRLQRHDTISISKI